jgi:hypothetical protein
MKFITFARIIELHVKNPDMCLSPMGRAIGLEPILVESVWHPTKEYNKLR